MKDIAGVVGIRPSSIYNHFNSKAEILDTIYQYFYDHVFYKKKPIEEMKEFIKTCTPLEFLESIHYSFDGESKQNYIRMSLITKIAYMRLFQDPTARDIILNYLGTHGHAYVKEVLQYGIDIGRIAPLDVDTFAICYNHQLHMMGISAFCSNDYTVDYIPLEIKIKELFSNMLTFYPLDKQESLHKSSN